MGGWSLFSVYIAEGKGKQWEVNTVWRYSSAVLSFISVLAEDIELRGSCWCVWLRDIREEVSFGAWGNTEYEKQRWAVLSYVNCISHLNMPYFWSVNTSAGYFPCVAMQRNNTILCLGSFSCTIFPGSKDKTEPPDFTLPVASPGRWRSTKRICVRTVYPRLI